jgi:putative membrane protein
MKTKPSIISTAIVALISVCFLQPAIAAKKSETKSGTNSEQGSVSAADKRFVENAAKGGMMEVAMGRAASSKAQNSEVKQFGARMVTDHSKANKELKSIASKKGLTIAKEEPSTNFKTDADYMQMMVKDHQKDLSEFQKEAKSGSDPDLKNFAEKTSKIISQHLSMARQISKSLKHEKSNLTR